MNLTDASVKRLVKRVAGKVESEGHSGFGLGTVNALDEYREWLYEERLHNGNQWLDWRTSDRILLLLDKLQNKEFIKNNVFKYHIIAHCLARDLLTQILYDWQRKTIAIDKMHKAKKDLAELVSLEQE